MLISSVAFFFEVKAHPAYDTLARAGHLGNCITTPGM